MERGISIGTGRHVFQKALKMLPGKTELDLSPRMIAMFESMASELAGLNQQISCLDREIRSIAQHDDDMCRLMEIPGVGPAIASALVAAVGTAENFDKARDMAAWLGLVPRQVSTGGKAKLTGISKHGNTYLRKLFIHGARAVLHLVQDRNTPITQWVDRLKERARVNVVAVAMANKMARITWAILTRGERYNVGRLIEA